jgi:predicted homoserine dehydrogenase-like protein
VGGLEIRDQLLLHAKDGVLVKIGAIGREDMGDDLLETGRVHDEMQMGRAIGMTPHGA